jgi:hypothetical protein
MTGPWRGKGVAGRDRAACSQGRLPGGRRPCAVDSRVPDRVADRLIAALRRALAAVSRGHGVSRVEVSVDATASLPDGRDAVRLTVSHDGTADGARSTATWQSPL